MIKRIMFALALMTAVACAAPKQPNSSTFIYQPGGSSDFGPGVYTDFATLYSDMSYAPAPRTLLFDDSQGTITLPTGSWDMTDVRWSSRGSATNPDIVNISEGTLLPGLRVIGGWLEVVNNATATPPVSGFSNNETLIVGAAGTSYVRLRNPGTASLFDFSNKTGITVALEGCYWGLAAGSASVAKAISGATITMRINDCLIGPDAVDAASGSTVTFTNIAPGFLAVDQSSVAGTMAIAHGNSARPRLRVMPQSIAGAAPVPSTSTVAATQTGDIVLYDTTAGDVVHNLPDINNSAMLAAGVPATTTGLMQWVKNVAGANDVNVTPAAGDTIDGSASAHDVAAGCGAAFASDGTTNWYIAAEYCP